MIVGIVNADFEATIPIVVSGASGQTLHLEALIDTGFDGWLSLPTDAIEKIGLPWLRRRRALLADGSETVYDCYQGVVVWEDRPLQIPIDEVNATPLVGMALLQGFELVMQVKVGGKVTISPLE